MRLRRHARTPDRRRWGSGFLGGGPSHRREDSISAAIAARPVNLQVCPQGCYWERAQRQVSVRSRLWGEAEVRTDFHFESRNCPHCGSLLVRACIRCQGPILLSGRDGQDPDDRCRECGLPFPWSTERREREGRRPADEPLRDEPGYSRALVRAGEFGELWLVADRVANLPVAAVLCPDDIAGHMWSDAAVEIRRASGQDVQRQAIDAASATVGKAWITNAGALPFEAVIHVAAMDRAGETQLQIALACIAEALELARERGLRSLAIPLAGWGPREIDQEEWQAAVAADAADFLTRGPLSQMAPMSVLLALPQADDLNTRSTEIEAAISRGVAGP